MPLKSSPGSQLFLTYSAVELLGFRILGAGLLMLPHPFEMLEGLLSTKLAHMLPRAMDWEMLIEPTLGGEDFSGTGPQGKLFGIGIMGFLMYLEARSIRIIFLTLTTLVICFAKMLGL